MSIVSTGQITLYDVNDTQTNLLDYSTWVPGTSGTQPGFNAWGTAPDMENSIIFGIDPFGRSSPLWKMTADITTPNSYDGGWTTDYFDVSDTKTYRFVVYIKRDTMDGINWIGFMPAAKMLNDVYSSTPFFIDGSPPQIGRWYAIIGYVHPWNTTITTSIGGVYDMVTGQKVANGADYKWIQGTTKAYQRIHYVWCATSGSTCYFWGPRAEVCDGSELPLEQIIDAIASDYQLSQMAADGVITPQEKPAILTRWCELYNSSTATSTLPTAPTIAGRYKTLRDAANTLGIWTPTTAGTPAKAFYDAAEALRAYLFTSPAVLLAANWNNNIAIVKDTWMTRWMTVESTADALQSAIAAKEADDAKAQAVNLIPRCLGLFAYSDRTSIVGMHENDLAVLYSTTLAERGIYAYIGTTWTKQPSPTANQVSLCFVYVLDAVRRGYGVSSDYVSSSVSFETILTNFLYVNVFSAIRAHIATGEITKLQASEINTDSIKAISGFFENISVTGTINNVSADQLMPTFTHRIKWDVDGTYTWTIPDHIKWMRFTVRGAGGGGSGGGTSEGDHLPGYPGGDGGDSWITGSIHGQYLRVAGGKGAPSNNPGAGGAISSLDDSNVYVGGRNGGPGTPGAGGDPKYEPLPGGTGGVPGAIIGLYNDIVEYSNLNQSISMIWLGEAATCPELSNGYNGYPGNGGAGGAANSANYCPAGYGGGAGAIRQLLTQIDEIAGQTLTIVIGAGGAGGLARAPNTYKGGRGGDGQVMIEW